jgi:nucleoid-associated protein YgaU
MGQFEKIVVLTVLFLVSVILVVSMRSEDGDLLAGASVAPALAEEGVEAGRAAPPAPVRLPGLGSTTAIDGDQLELPDFDEIVAADRVVAGRVVAGHVLAGHVFADHVAVVAPVDGVADGMAEEKAPGLMLASNVSTSVADGVEGAGADGNPVTPAGLPRGSALITDEGLEETLPGGDRLYTWRAGDSFVALARRFYGDPRAAEWISRANEGRGEIAEGEQIWMPLHVGRAEGVAVGGEEGDFTYYTVGEGDSLWNIARRHAGDGNAYLRIFEANEDVLGDIDAVLRPGTELRLP